MKLLIYLRIRQLESVNNSHNFLLINLKVLTPSVECEQLVRDHKALIMNYHKVSKRKAEHQQSVNVSEPRAASRIIKTVIKIQQQNFQSKILFGDTV